MGLGLKISNEIFRKDQPQIFARNRQLAKIMPVMLAFQSAGYKAGVVLARNSVSGLYDKYDDAAASGLGVAVGVLLHDVSDAPSGGVEAAQCCVGGELYESLLTGLDANGKTDLKSRSVIDARGDTVLMF